MVKDMGMMLDAAKDVDDDDDDDALLELNMAVHDVVLLWILSPPTSTMLRMAMMSSMSQSWKRSTTSAHVIWKRDSFSNFLNTVPLISTNWLDMSSVRSAFEYELTATLSVTTW